MNEERVLVPDRKIREARRRHRLFDECAQWGGVAPDKAARAVDPLLGLDRVTSPDELMRCVVR